MQKEYYPYELLVSDSKAFIGSLKQNYDAILVVARGGMSFAHLLAEGLNIRDIALVSLASYDETVQRDTVTINKFPDLDSSKRYLIVEDIVDSGKSMMVLSQELYKRYPDLAYDVVALFYKKTAAYKPTYYFHEAKAWIEFFWEVDL